MHRYDAASVIVLLCAAEEGVRTVSSKPTAKLKKIESLEKSARDASSRGDWFEADRSAYEAVSLAYAMDSYGRMPEMLELLKQSRGRRFREAIETGELNVVEDPQSRDELLNTEVSGDLAPGCYLVQPPLVGADGRNIRDLFFEMGVPALVVVREPKTERGFWPVVMVGPVTVRAYVAPPEGERPTIEWMEEAVYELGDSAIETVNADAEPVVRINELMDRLGTVVLHDRLIDVLIETCGEAIETLRRQQSEADAKAAEKG